MKKIDFFKNKKGKPPRSFIYAAILLTTFIASLLFFIWILVFHIRLIKSLAVSSEEDAGFTGVFDMSNFELIVKKLGLSTSTASLALPLSEEAGEVLSINILNGTLTRGLAKEWQKKFEAANFLNVAIGNAAKKDYSGIQVFYRASEEGALDLVKKVLKDNGVEDEDIKEEEAEEGEYDIIIVLGQ
ncbi:LytR C-terminal domain-containing protein [Candidatus Wolfebacteria bacterium]|nr:LytR C-terminal domain-containing protein [Candidatus Wolfebacteria bacterium]